MANAKQCDVCGKYFPAIKDVNYLDKIVLTNHENFCNVGTMTYDLCPNCMKKVTKILKIPTNDESSRK